MSVSIHTPMISPEPFEVCRVGNRQIEGEHGIEEKC
jgi:hypothetical protein